MRAPKLPSIFKSQRNKQFNLPSRYYDPRKERLEELQNKYDQQGEGSNYQPPRKVSFRDSSGHAAFGKSRADKNSSIRLVAIIIALSAAAYYILFHMEVDLSFLD